MYKVTSMDELTTYVQQQHTIQRDTIVITTISQNKNKISSNNKETIVEKIIKMIFIIIIIILLVFRIVLFVGERERADKSVEMNQKIIKDAPNGIIQ